MIEANVRPTDTKARILDAAEKLFGLHGFSATSLRAITAEADVNLAAVNYHFQSKDALIEAVFARRIGPVNKARLQKLEAIEARAGDGPLPLEEVVEALLGEVLRLKSEPGGEHFGRAMGKMFSEDPALVQRVIGPQMGEIIHRFGAAVRRSVPYLSPEELLWRMHFTIGAMAFTMAGTPLLALWAPGRADLTNVDEMIRRITTFVAGGLRAPEPARNPR